MIRWGHRAFAAIHLIVVFPAILAFFLLSEWNADPEQRWKSVVAFPLYLVFGVFAFLGSCVEWLHERILPPDNWHDS